MIIALIDHLEQVCADLPINFQECFLKYLLFFHLSKSNSFSSQVQTHDQEKKNIKKLQMLGSNRAVTLVIVLS